MMAPRGQLTDNAYQLVLQRLRNGEYASGQRISIEDLVIELGSSRQPVMDALKRLATEGFVVIIPQVGVRVVVPEHREFVDFFRLMAAIEGLCAELAAERADDAGVARLVELNAAFGELIRNSVANAEETPAFRTINYAFHAQVRAMCKSPGLMAYAEGLWARGDFYISTAIGRVMFVDRVVESFDEHEIICQAIASHDPHTARREMEQHILAFARQISAPWELPKTAYSPPAPRPQPSR